MGQSKTDHDGQEHDEPPTVGDVRGYTVVRHLELTRTLLLRPVEA